MSEAEELIALETRRCQAIAEGNKAALRGMLSDDYLHVYGGGLSGDRDDWIAHVTEVPRYPVREDLKVRIYGDAAVITGRMINRIRPGDGAKAAEQIGGRVPVREDVVAFATQVLVRSDGEWKFVSFQMTRCVD